MSTVNVLPNFFHRRWMNGNFKYTNKFSEHDNYKTIERYGEYLDMGYGKKRMDDLMHKSNPIFLSRDKPLSSSSQTPPIDVNEVRISRIHSSPPETTTSSQINHFHHRRFPKHHQPPKIPCVSTLDNYHRLDVYLEQKKRAQSQSSLAFESELFKSASTSKRVANEPYRQRCAHPWRYFFTRRNYQTCSEQFRRSKTSCIDLSRY